LIGKAFAHHFSAEAACGAGRSSNNRRSGGRQSAANFSRSTSSPESLTIKVGKLAAA
jgi:hypothetical protein